MITWIFSRSGWNRAGAQAPNHSDFLAAPKNSVFLLESVNRGRSFLNFLGVLLFRASGSGAGSEFGSFNYRTPLVGKQAGRPKKLTFSSIPPWKFLIQWGKRKMSFLCAWVAQEREIILIFGWTFSCQKKGGAFVDDQKKLRFLASSYRKKLSYISFNTLLSVNQNYASCNAVGLAEVKSASLNKEGADISLASYLGVKTQYNLTHCLSCIIIFSAACTPYRCFYAFSYLIMSASSTVTGYWNSFVWKKKYVAAKPTFLTDFQKNKFWFAAH